MALCTRYKTAGRVTLDIVEGGCSCIIMLILGVLGIIVAVAFMTGIVQAMLE